MNWTEILDLLNVIEKTRQLPKLKTIYDAANKELEEIAAGTWKDEDNG